MTISSLYKERSLFIESIQDAANLAKSYSEFHDLLCTVTHSVIDMELVIWSLHKSLHQNREQMQRMKAMHADKMREISKTVSKYYTSLKSAEEKIRSLNKKNVDANGLYI